jgi:hypothetical protein
MKAPVRRSGRRWNSNLIKMDLRVAECELMDLIYVAQVLSFWRKLSRSSLDFFFVHLLGTEAFSCKRV